MSKAKETISALAAEGVEASPLEMDVSQPNSIQAAFKTLSAKHEQLDALVNNAGVLLDFGTTVSELSIDNLRASFETNFFGAFATIQAFLPMLMKAPAARIVNMSGDMGGESAPFSVEQGAAPAVWLAMLGDHGPTGGFFSQTLGGKKHAW